MCRPCAGNWRHMAGRNGTKWTEGPGLPEPCRGGNTLLAFRFVSGGSAWESNPPRTPLSARHRF